ncbi:S41 family peptidase [Cryomorpha ignava]|uniref:S41 family peptidase n=1 Tax=Cryomorpha ignava TaxID=101383 RepID=A0A7K3WPV2_9FLAO|nr:S41 family peptidase [Cryomorpha ignava]NEN23518.1 S41 family peptidase [Cryomorpha ignava]
MKTGFKKLLVIGGLAATGAIGIFATSAKDNFFEISKNLEIFATLYRELNVFYVDDVQPGDMMKTGIDAMLESLDPYTTYITESNIEDYRFMTTGQYGGIGSLIRSVDGDVYISEPYEGFPAFKSGLKAGDKLLMIDGVTIEGKDQEEISKMLKGQSGTQLEVTFERFGEIQKVMLKREEIKIPDVPYYGMIDENIGYIRLTSFTQTASQEVKEAFLDLRDKQGMKELIFDLRGNGGGLLREAVNIVNLFVPRGQEVVSTKGKIEEWDRKHITLSEPVDLNIPLVILVDGGSASASEIVSGTIQDLDRGVVIGNRTYGKGLVQQTRDLQYNNKLKLTVAKYYIPSGRCIQKLDYSHKNDDGIAEEVPDSLLKVFYTENGRKVMDGRGIEPDLLIQKTEFPHILASLLSESLFFKYSNKYAAEHSEIAAATEFRLSDEEYEAFMAYLEDKNYSYTTDTERELEELVKIAKKEKYWGLAESEFSTLETVLKSKKKKDLIIFKDEIEDILVNEIVSRYYYQRGRIESSLASDIAVAEAKRVLKEPSEYQAILKPV